MVKSGQNLEGKCGQELLSCRISNFEPDVMPTRIFRVFILFGTVTSGDGILGAISKRLHNIGSRFELMLLFWFTIFAKVDGFEKFKIATCST